MSESSPSSSQYLSAARGSPTTLSSPITPCWSQEQTTSVPQWQGQGTSSSQTHVNVSQMIYIGWCFSQNQRGLFLFPASSYQVWSSVWGPESESRRHTVRLVVIWLHIKGPWAPHEDVVSWVIWGHLCRTHSFRRRLCAGLEDRSTFHEASPADCVRSSQQISSETKHVNQTDAISKINAQFIKP